jgi:acetoacetyl-CoA reductase
MTMAKTALVTGGTRGIGAAIAKALKAAGYTVAANYGGNDEAAAKFTAETGIKSYKWDVGDFDACTAGIAEVVADLGPIDVLVNNAGITRDGMFHKMTKDQWSAVIRTNLDSLFNMTRPVWESMRDRSFGRIIVISSVNGQKGQMGQVNYSAAKAGDIGFVKALAQEGAAKGITVNAICPGYIGTEMVMAIDENVLKTRILPQIPVGGRNRPLRRLSCKRRCRLHHRFDPVCQWRPEHGLTRRRHWECKRAASAALFVLMKTIRTKSLNDTLPPLPPRALAALFRKTVR